MRDLPYTERDRLVTNLRLAEGAKRVADQQYAYAAQALADYNNQHREEPNHG